MKRSESDKIIRQVKIIFISFSLGATLSGTQDLVMAGLGGPYGLQVSNMGLQPVRLDSYHCINAMTLNFISS